MINTIIIDDHILIAEGLKSSLEKSDSIYVIGTRTTAKDGIVLIKENIDNDKRINVVILDIKLPDESGLIAAEKIFKIDPNIKILVLTSYDQKYYIKSMLNIGVQGYLLKSAEPEEIIEAIICINYGETYFCKEVRKIMKGNETTIVISKREIEVLRLIAQGLTNQEISEILYISPLTVDTHRKNLILKLGAKNTASLINIASIEGFI